MNDLGVLSAVRQHWGLVLLITAMWCLAAGIYLKFTPWAYTSTAKLSVEPTGPRILSGEERQPIRSAGYVAQQCEVIKSAPILRDAIGRLDPGDRTSLARTSDPVEFLKESLDVSVNKKNEVITIGFDSPDPRQGACVVGTVVEAYLDHRTRQQQDTSKEVLRILQKELVARETELAAKQNALVTLNQESGLAWADEKTDMATQQLGRLYEALTESQLAILNAQASYEAAKALAHDPVRLRLFAESQGIVDRQTLSETSPAQLVVERSRLEAQLASLRQELSDEHPSVQSLKARLETVTAQIAQQTNGAAEQCLDVLRQRLQMARGREVSIRQSLQVSQQSNADLAKRSLLLVGISQVQRLCDILKNRIMETGAPRKGPAALDVRIIEPVFTASSPTSPKIGMHLAAAGGIGAMVGTLLALRRERCQRPALGRSSEERAAGSDAKTVAWAVRPAAVPLGTEADQPLEEFEEVAAGHSN